MNTYLATYTHGLSAPTVEYVEAKTSDDAWREIQENYPGQKCILHDIKEV